MNETGKPHHPAPPPGEEESAGSLAELVELLNLEAIENNIFRGISPKDRWQRVYGGQVLGQALVADLEELVRARGGFTIQLGTDDETYMTSLSGIDLYPNVLEHLRNIRNLRSHPYEFYQKCGFVIVGVLPDANGPGKPDIFMAKAVRHK